MFHLLAYTASLATAGPLQLTPAASEQVIQALSNGYVVPPDLPLLGFAHANGVTLQAIQVQTPSLRRMFSLDLSPLNVTALPVPPDRFYDRLENPWSLYPNESIIVTATQGSGGTEREWCFLYLFDQPPVRTSGQILTVRATGTTTLTANAWTLVPLTFTQVLAPGMYQVVGMQAQALHALAARLVFVGGKYRPGVMGSVTLGDMAHPMFRNGTFGNFGAPFAHNALPQMEFFATAGDTAEEVYLDLVKVA